MLSCPVLLYPILSYSILLIVLTTDSTKESKKIAVDSGGCDDVMMICFHTWDKGALQPKCLSSIALPLSSYKRFGREVGNIVRFSPRCPRTKRSSSLHALHAKDVKNSNRSWTQSMTQSLLAFCCVHTNMLKHCAGMCWGANKGMKHRQQWPAINH